MESLGDREVSRGNPRMSRASCSEGILNLGDSCPDLPSSPFAEYLTLDSHLEAHNDILPHPFPPLPTHTHSSSYERASSAA